MKKYIIERNVPEIGKSTAAQLQAAAQKSNAALEQLAPQVHWVHSYVAENKTFCLYLATNEEVIRKHAELSGFPANKITEVKNIFDPTTANGSK